MIERVFMQYLAKHNGYELNFNDVDSKEMILASIHGVKGDMLLIETTRLTKSKSVHILCIMIQNGEFPKDSLGIGASAANEIA